MSPIEMLTASEFFLLGLIATFSKDKVVSGVAYVYAFIHFFNIYYNPTSWLDLCFEAATCLILGFIVISQTVRVWAVALALTLIASISLILIEFIDYFAYNSYFEATYLQWIHATTILEIIILASAQNGHLHYYTDGFWTDIHRMVTNNTNKIFTRQA